MLAVSYVAEQEVEGDAFAVLVLDVLQFAEEPENGILSGSYYIFDELL